jgi:hypothetical protein
MTTAMVPYTRGQPGYGVVRSATTMRSRYGAWDVDDEFVLRSVTPQMDVRPLNFRKDAHQRGGAVYGAVNEDMASVRSLRQSVIRDKNSTGTTGDKFYMPATSVRSRQLREEGLNTLSNSMRGRRLQRDERPKTSGTKDTGSARNRYQAPPPTPKRTSSKGATLKRRYTVAEPKRNSTVEISQLDGSSDMPEKKKSSAGARGMAWLQRPEKKATKSGMAEALRELPSPINIETKKDPRDRSFTDPVRPATTDSATARGDGDMAKRAISSGSRFKKAFSIGSDNSTDEDSLDHDSTGDKKAKGWKKRVFSKDFFKPESKAHKLENITVLETTIESPEYGPSVTSGQSGASEPFRTSGGSPTPSIRSVGSDRTVVTRQSQSGSYSGSDASQAASTTEDFQFDGVGSVPLDDNSTEKVFNDSVIGMIDGKVGTRSRPKGGQQWKPPILTLDVQVISSIDRLPVKVRPGSEYWVAVVLRGLVVGDIDTPGTIGNAAGIGLDVGVLLDIS